MNTDSKILPIVIVVVLALVVVYLYFFKDKVSATSTLYDDTVSGTTPPATGPCSTLISEKAKVDSLYSLAQSDFVKYSDSLTGNYTNEIREELKSRFVSSESAYKIQVILYNRIVTRNNCGPSLVIENKPFIYKGVSYTDPSSGAVCDMSSYKSQVDVYYNLTNMSYADFKSAPLNQKASKYMSYQNNYNLYSKAVDDYNAKAKKCFDEQGIKIDFLNKMNFYTN